MNNKIKKFKETIVYNDLIEKHKKQLEKNLKKRKLADQYKELANLKQKKKDIKDINKLKYTHKIKINSLNSDERFIKNVDKLSWYQWIKKLKRFMRKEILTIVHRHDNVDIARYYPIEAGKILINKKYYLFNPKHVRYINGRAVLYLYENHPFAKLIIVNEEYSEPTITTEAFTSVLTSKFVTDAVEGEKPKFLNIIMNVIMVILILICLVMTFMNYSAINKILSAMGG